MSRQGWIVRVGRMPNCRWIGKDGKPSAIRLGDAFIFTTFAEAFTEADLYVESVVQRRWEDDWRE